MCSHCTATIIHMNRFLIAASCCLFSTQRSFCGCHHYGKSVCWTDKEKHVTLHFSCPKQTDTVAGSRKQAALLPPPGPVWRQKSHTYSAVTYTTHPYQSAHYLFPQFCPAGSPPVCHRFFRQNTCLSKSHMLAFADRPDKPRENFKFCSGEPPWQTGLNMGD